MGQAPTYLDVGPTTIGYVDGRPVTDDRVNFEDLILFAINFAPKGKSSVANLCLAGTFEKSVNVPALCSTVSPWCRSLRAMSTLSRESS